MPTTNAQQKPRETLVAFTCNPTVTGSSRQVQAKEFGAAEKHPFFLANQVDSIGQFFD
jgi:hypothetical protein